MTDSTLRCDDQETAVAPRTPLVQATATHLVVSQRVVLRLITALALVGVILGVIGLREAFTRLSADGDTVLTVAIVVASVVTAAALFVGLVVIPRRVRSTRTP